MDSFTAKDICAIIKTCSQSGVTEFKLEGLEFCLGHKEPAEEYIETAGTEIPMPRMDLTEQQKQEIEYARRQELVATNPVAFEQEMLDHSEAILIDEAYYGDQEYETRNA